jgi:branched-chain amino acid transport system substrate-binding protein
MISRRSFLQAGGATAALMISRTPASAANAPGVTDTEIKIGQTLAYSGPISAATAIGRAEAAYFKTINEKGGISGRKINFISLDDGFSPPKTVEQTHYLIEGEQVALMFGSIGTAPNLAVRQYLNDNKIPQILIFTGAAKLNDPKHFPWTMGANPTYQGEAHIYTKQILATSPNAKIAVLYQNDDYGKDYLAGLKGGFGAHYEKLVVKEASYEVSDPTVDTEIIALQGSGADTFINFGAVKFASQAIRKAYDIGWKPVQYLSAVASSVGSILKPAGLEKCVGITTALWAKDVSDPRWKDDPGVKQFLDFMKVYLPGADVTDAGYGYGYGTAATLEQVLKQCGDDLSRENIMRQTANLKDFELPLLLPGIKINTAPDNYVPIRQMQLARFNGRSWELFGDVISG